MVAATTRRATYEDLLAVPDHVVAEILDGELLTSPRPAPRHARATMALANAIGPPFQPAHGGGDGWVLLFEPEVHLADDVLVPDLARWRYARLPELPDTASSRSRPTGCARSSRRPRSGSTGPASSRSTRAKG